MSPVPLRLLLIEDTPDDAELLRLELRRAGYAVEMHRVETLGDMDAALAKQEWDLVVSDHSMPGMTSLSALSLLRQHDLDLPFIIFSGGIGEEEAVAAMRAGAQDYVMKGNVARLMPAIDRELKQAEARRERRRAEAAVRDLEQMRAFALESANIGEWQIDPATQAFRASPRYFQLFGHREVPATWTYENIRSQLLEEDRERHLDAYNRALRGESQVDAEFRVRWPDGSIHWLWTRARRFEPANRSPLVAGVVADITQRKETEAQLHQALKMEAIGQLTGGIAHDFNNLLTVILGNSGLLVESVADKPELAELVEGIHNAGRSGAELTRRLLTFARQQPLQVRDIDLGRHLRDSASMLRQPLGPNISLELEIEPRLPAVRVDPAQLATAVLNLVINARDAMPGGGAIVISARRGKAAGSESGPTVELAVGDTGEGMPPEVAARAVEPFFTTKQVGKGTGLGLSMVYGFARQSGGQLTIDSAPGCGTVVTIELPGVAAAAGSDTQPANAPEAPTARSTTILVVDDDRAVRTFLVAVCCGLGHRVIEAADGAEALAALAASPDVELLFSDVAMPNSMNGYELAKAARQQRPDLKILLTSGFPAKDVLRHGALDADISILQKPYEPAELAANITQALAGRPGVTAPLQPAG